MTDAAHLMADMTGFFISILAMYLTKKQKNDNYNYGYSR
jgi:Co/Zn/Cd efflux system component